MKSVILTLLAWRILVTPCAFAQIGSTQAKQNYTFVWGPDLKLKGDMVPSKILLSENGNFYATTEHENIFYKTAYLARFNSKMELDLQKEISFKSIFKSDNQVALIELDKAIYAIERE